MSNKIHIAVRHLVEYVFRSGSIDSGFHISSTLTEGTKAHQKIQKQYNEQDRKEVYVSMEIPCNDLIFVVDGRCDGLLATEQGFMIDEIKSTAMDIGLVTEGMFPVHWAQAKCYAYMIAKEKELPSILVQLTYVQKDTEEQRRFVQQAAVGELETFVAGILERYAPYAMLLQRHRESRDRSIAELAFPFDAYREGQRRLAGAVYRTIEEGKKLFAKAPTGTGKTISTTFPAVIAVGKGLLQRIFYLTAKTITRTVVEEAFSLMQSKGLHMHVVTITAKEKICFQEETRCMKETCEFADGYYDRLNVALMDLLTNETLMSRAVIERYARKHRLCPFELSLDASYAADAVICDYNYIFDPRVSMKRLFNEQKKQTALLVDEAHNLVDRAREMFSATLNKSEFMAVQREFKGANREIHRAAKAINDYFNALIKLGGDQHQVRKEPSDELVAMTETFIVQAEKELASSSSKPGHPLLLEAYFACQAFIRMAKLFDERFVAFTEASRGNARLKLYCLDPSQLLQQMGKGYRSHIYFSATLSPLGYYMDMLGAGPDDYTVSVPSPFSKEQLEVTIQPLSTRYHDREKTREPLVAMLHELVRAKQGNYLFFFPSYEYMNAVHEVFAARKPDSVQTIVQQSEMPDEERVSFLSAFAAGNRHSVAGFAVMGGIFSEGIDLAGDRLIGVVVVGVGLPQIGPERNRIKEYFDSAGKPGFEYAYVFPGMNKVLQAGGRLIRSERDSGRLVLVDDRYLQPLYQRLLPEEWKHSAVLR